MHVLSGSVMSDLFGIPWTIATRLLCPWGFSRKDYWSGLPCPPGDLPNPEIEPRSPTLQTDSLPFELLGKPMSTGVVAYPFSRESSQPRNQGSPVLQANSLPAKLPGNPRWAFTRHQLAGEKEGTLS